MGTTHEKNKTTKLSPSITFTKNITIYLLFQTLLFSLCSFRKKNT